jgi:hypothetical protein
MNNYLFSLLIIYGSSYMFRHYIDTLSFTKLYRASKRVRWFNANKPIFEKLLFCEEKIMV